MSSCLPDCLSVENGVFSSSTGLRSKCLEIRLSLARGLARAEFMNVIGFGDVTSESGEDRWKLVPERT